MDVQEFVANALLAIAKGVQTAQSDSSAGSMVGRRPVVLPNGVAFNTDQDNNLVGFVEFDLAVAAEQTVGGGAGIKVMGFNAGGNASGQTTYTNRLKFSVPLGYPAPPAQKAALEAADARRKAEYEEQSNKLREAGRALY